MKAGEAHRRGFEPRRIRFGVEAVHQHARCIGGRVTHAAVYLRGNATQSARRNCEQAAGVEPAQADPDNHQQSARNPGKVAPTGMRLHASAVLPLDDTCSTQRIGLAPILLPEGAHQLLALRRRSDLLVAVERIELSRLWVWTTAVPSTDRKDVDNANARRRENRGQGAVLGVQ